MRLNLSYSLIETGPIVCLIRVPSMRMLKRFPISPSNRVLSLRPRNVAMLSGLDGVNSGARQVLVDSLQVRLLAENDIGGVLALVGAPVISSREIAINRTVPTRELIQLSVMRLAVHPLAIRWARGQSAISTKALSMSRYSIPCLRN